MSSFHNVNGEINYLERGIFFYIRFQVIWSLHQTQITDYMLYIINSDDEELYYIYILEILSLLLREQRPSDIANAAVQRSATEKQHDEAELIAIRHRELLKKSERIKKFTGSRYRSPIVSREVLCM